MASYAERFLDLAARTDPRLCFPTVFHGFSIADAQRNPDTEIKRRVVDANVDKTTGEVVPLPLRWGFFAIGSAPVVAACIVAKTPLMMALSQGANQTYNAALNFTHRNKSAPVSTHEIAQGYCAATGSSMGVAVLLKSITPARYSYFIAYPAVAVGNIFNTMFMRKAELQSGITVTGFPATSTPGICGMSPAAAQHAVMSTAVSRAILPMPAFLVAPMVLKAMERVLQRPAPLAVVVVLQTVALQFGIPLTLAMFPEKGEMHANQVEADVATRCPQAERFVYEKGL